MFEDPHHEKECLLVPHFLLCNVCIFCCNVENAPNNCPQDFNVRKHKYLCVSFFRSILFFISNLIVTIHGFILINRKTQSFRSKKEHTSDALNARRVIFIDYVYDLYARIPHHSIIVFVKVFCAAIMTSQCDLMLQFSIYLIVEVFIVLMKFRLHRLMTYLCL